MIYLQKINFKKTNSKIDNGNIKIEELLNDIEELNNEKLDLESKPKQKIVL